MKGPIVSGFRTADRPTHNGVDIAVGKGTPIHAAASASTTSLEMSIRSPSFHAGYQPSIHLARKRTARATRFSAAATVMPSLAAMSP